MNSFRTILLAIAATSVLACTAAGEEKPLAPQTSKPGLPVFDNSRNEPSSLANARRKQESIAELRQARALLQADQRRARMERNAWLGHEPLRPHWNAVPYSRSRYERRAIVVPIFAYR
jgi:hypothetical protein